VRRRFHAGVPPPIILILTRRGFIGVKRRAIFTPPRRRQ